MKRIVVDNKILIINQNILSIERKRLIQSNPGEWKIETYQETLCHNLNLNCEGCIFLNDKCSYQDWHPGLIKGKNE